MPLTPQEIADKQIRRAQAAVPDYKRGVEGITENPLAKAADAKDKWLAGIQQAAADNTFEDGLRGVDFNEWKRRTSEKGGQRYAAGVADSRPLIEDFQTQIAPHRERVKSQVASMPSTTYEDRKQRMIANADGMHTFTFRRRRTAR